LQRFRCLGSLFVIQRLLLLVIDVVVVTCSRRTFKSVMQWVAGRDACWWYALVLL
jgi:hypothetical protein